LGDVSGQVPVQEHVELIREAFFYAERFRGRTFVIQIDDSLIGSAVLKTLVKDLVMLYRTGIRMVLVTGARNRIDEVLSRYAVQSRKVAGVRISSPAAIPFIKMAAFDVSNELMTELSANDTNAVIGNWVRARSLGVRNGIDYQDAGAVERIKLGQLISVLDQGLIPVFPCIGWSATGKLYNVSSRELAAVLSIELAADKLFFLVPSQGINASEFVVPDGVTASPDGSISRMNLEQVQAFLEANADHSSWDEIEYVGLALRSARSGVDRVHIIDGRVDGVLLKEIFSNFGFGTMVYANQYESIRNMTTQDIPAVLRVMRPAMDRGYLVHRDEQDLTDQLGDFVVYETDGNLHGCGALHRYDDEQAEILALSVDQRYAHLGIGQKIVRYLIDRARDLGLRSVFVLTTQTSDWFETLGFRAADLGEIPRQKRAVYNRSRNSRILLREL
jgi:amino-acid N-acetyltransferase